MSGHVRSPLVWIAALGLVPGIAFSVMAWGGSVMMLIPLAVYVGLRVVMDVRGGVSPGMGNIPLAVGMTIGAIVIVFLHFRWEWHDGYVAYIALIVAGGTVGVLAIGEVWRYLDVHPGGLLAIQVIGVLAGIVGFRQWFSEEWEGVCGTVEATSSLGIRRPSSRPRFSPRSTATSSGRSCRLEWMFS